MNIFVFFLHGSEKSVIFAENNYLFFIAMNPLYKDIRGKVLTDFYSEYDLQMLGFSLEEFSIDPNADDYQKASDLSDAALDIEDKELQEAAEALLREMQEKEGYGRE